MTATRPPGRQVPWFLITGLVIGFLGGLFWAWWGDPVQYQNVTPAGLRADYRADYRGLVALAYQTHGDIGRARARLEQLGDVDPASALESQAARMEREGMQPETVQALARLADDLRAFALEEELAEPAPDETAGVDDETAAAQPAGTRQPGTPAGPALTQPPTLTPRPTHTASPTPGAPFALVDNLPMCEPAQPGLMTITVMDAAGQPAAGIPILVTWPGGQDLFFTGLAPEISPGYADFKMAAGVVYAVRVGDEGVPVEGMSAQECPNGLGGITLTFRQP